MIETTLELLVKTKYRKCLLMMLSLATASVVLHAASLNATAAQRELISELGTAGPQRLPSQPF